MNNDTLVLSKRDVLVLYHLLRDNEVEATNIAKGFKWLETREDDSLRDNRERSEFERKLLKLGLVVPWSAWSERKGKQVSIAHRLVRKPVEQRVADMMASLRMPDTMFFDQCAIAAIPVAASQLPKFSEAEHVVKRAFNIAEAMVEERKRAGTKK